MALRVVRVEVGNETKNEDNEISFMNSVDSFDIVNNFTNQMDVIKLKLSKKKKKKESKL